MTTQSSISHVVGRTSATLAWMLIHLVRMSPLPCVRPWINLLLLQYSSHSWSVIRWHPLPRLKELPNTSRLNIISNLITSFALKSGSLWKSSSSRKHLKSTILSFQEMWEEWWRKWTKITSSKWMLRKPLCLPMLKVTPSPSITCNSVERGLRRQPNITTAKKTCTIHVTYQGWRHTSGLSIKF